MDIKKKGSGIYLIWHHVGYNDVENKNHFPDMRKFIYFLSMPLFLSFLLLFSSCEPFPGEEPVQATNSPHCVIVNQTSINFPASGFPKMEITVTNDGPGPTAYKVGCYVRLKKANQVIDEDNVLFGTLAKGKTATQEAWFPDLSSSSSYENIETELYWYDLNDNYYTEN